MMNELAEKHGLYFEDTKNSNRCSYHFYRRPGCPFIIMVIEEMDKSLLLFAAGKTINVSSWEDAFYLGRLIVKGEHAFLKEGKK